MDHKRFRLSFKIQTLNTQNIYDCLIKIFFRIFFAANAAIFVQCIQKRKYNSMSDFGDDNGYGWNLRWLSEPI